MISEGSVKRIKRRKIKQKEQMKGQFFSYDAIVAGILFILLLTLLYNYWNSLRNSLSINIDDQSRIGISVSNMILTPGYPENWNSSNFNKLGITKGHNTIEIDESKLGNLSNLYYQDYNLLKERLGVGPYEIYIELNNTEIGIKPSDNVNAKVKISRPVIYKDSLQNLSITIWAITE